MIDQYLDAVADNPADATEYSHILQARVGYDPENGRGGRLAAVAAASYPENPDQPVYAEMLIWLFIQQKDFSSAFIQAESVGQAIEKTERG